MLPSNSFSIMQAYNNDLDFVGNGIYVMFPQSLDGLSNASIDPTYSSHHPQTSYSNFLNTSFPVLHSQQTLRQQAAVLLPGDSAANKCVLQPIRMQMRSPRSIPAPIS
ncbi:hypothetical protein BC938DRAFT_471777 [Jimgerdemannia flammicorona]|uniref:Uncharacterized protein n=1 Tax=Jimgerdemannia flammicorona TaxID=994334 RepID=A0A433Q7B3_9FUNG|nr:hypothetical protein BC938DRAFT_471777 [Jimgerdemannia flammicorona]